MKRYTFIVREYDAQASITKYYKIHKYGNEVAQAYSKAQRYVDCRHEEDYHFDILTLSEFNKLHK